jgi:hypothetical protein
VTRIKYLRLNRTRKDEAMQRYAGAVVGSEANPLIYAFPPDYFYTPCYDWQNPVEFDPFWLVFPTFATLAIGIPNQQQVVIPNEADFECRRILYHVDTAGAQLTNATAIIPNVTISIKDSGSGRDLMNAPASLACVARPENIEPGDMAWPKIFTRNSTISVTLTNFDAAVATNNIRLTFAGRKIFSRL